MRCFPISFIVCKTIINNPPNHHCYRWHKPFSNGWFVALFYLHSIILWLQIIIFNSNVNISVIISFVKYIWVNYNIHLIYPAFPTGHRPEDMVLVVARPPSPEDSAALAEPSPRNAATETSGNMERKPRKIYPGKLT